MNKCKPCGKDMDRQRTHWEGCHTSHPECAAYRAGYEAGLRRAAEIAEGYAQEFSTLGKYHADQDSRDRCFARARSATIIHDAILAQIGK